MLTLLGQESITVGSGAGSDALTIPEGTKAIVLAGQNHEGVTDAVNVWSADPDLGGVTFTRYQSSRFAFAADVTGRSDDLLDSVGAATATVMVYYLSGTGPALWEQAAAASSKTCAAPTNGGNVFGAWVSRGYGGGSKAPYFDYLDADTAAGAGDAYVGHADVGGENEAVKVGHSGSWFLYGVSAQLFIYESMPMVVQEPSRLGEEVAFRAGLEITAPTDGTVYLYRLGEHVAFRPGLRIASAAKRQVALVGEGIETPEMTEGGGESNVLTFHVDRKPTWEERGLTAAEVAALLTPEWYVCDSLTVTNGTLGTGSHTDLHAVGGGAVRIDEATGTPGILAVLAFSGVDALTAWQARLYYVGTHEVSIQLYNYDTSGWDTLDTVGDGSDYALHSGTLATGDSYFDGSGNAQLRFYHPDPGNPSHDLFIDYVVIGHTTSGSVAMALDDLTDVNAPTPSEGDVLTWDDGAGEWVNAAPASGALALDDLTDVNAPTPSDNDVLAWDADTSAWVPVAPGTPDLSTAALDDIGDVDAATPGDGDVLTWDAGAGDWIAATPAAGSTPPALRVYLYDTFK